VCECVCVRVCSALSDLVSVAFQLEQDKGAAMVSSTASCLGGVVYTYIHLLTLTLVGAHTTRVHVMRFLLFLFLFFLFHVSSRRRSRARSSRVQTQRHSMGQGLDTALPSPEGATRLTYSTSRVHINRIRMAMLRIESRGTTRHSRSSGGTACTLQPNEGSSDPCLHNNSHSSMKRTTLRVSPAWPSLGWCGRREG
jgi:hypothetical protein